MWQRIYNELSRRLAFASDDFIHLLHTIQQLIKKLAHGCPPYLRGGE